MKSKFNNEKTIEELQHASPVKPGKRFQSFFVDCLIVTIISYIFFSCANLIVSNTSVYKNAENIVREEVAYFNDYLSESRAMEFEIINGEKVRKDQIIDEGTGISKIVLENINRAIYYSYELFGDFESQFGLSIDQDDLELIKTSVSDNGYEVDNNISYFYCHYLLNSEDSFSVSFASKTEAQLYVQEEYKDAFSENANDMFVFDLNQSPVPVLKTKAAYYLYYYIYIGSDSEINGEAEQYYYAFDTAYSGMLSTASKLMITSEPYYSTHYKNYSTNDAIVGGLTNVALIISIFLGYTVGILLPKLIFKHERTFGRLLFKLGGISLENEPVSWKVTLIKSLLGCIGYLSISFLIYMFPPFNGSFRAMAMPFIGEVPYMIILIVILVVAIINSCIMLFTQNKVGVEGLITGSILVDRTRLDEFEVEEE